MEAETGDAKIKCHKEYILLVLQITLASKTLVTRVFLSSRCQLTIFLFRRLLYQDLVPATKILFFSLILFNFGVQFQQCIAVIIEIISLYRHDYKNKSYYTLGQVFVQFIMVWHL